MPSRFCLHEAPSSSCCAIVVRLRLRLCHTCASLCHASQRSSLFQRCDCDRHSSQRPCASLFQRSSLLDCDCDSSQATSLFHGCVSCHHDCIYKNAALNRGVTKGCTKAEPKSCTKAEPACTCIRDEMYVPQLGTCSTQRNTSACASTR